MVKKKKENTFSYRKSTFCNPELLEITHIFLPMEINLKIGSVKKCSLVRRYNIIFLLHSIGKLNTNVFTSLS